LVVPSFVPLGCENGMAKCLSTEFFRFPQNYGAEGRRYSFQFGSDISSYGFVSFRLSIKDRSKLRMFCRHTFALFFFAVGHFCCIVNMAYEIWRTGMVVAFNTVDIFDRRVRVVMNLFPKREV